MLVANETTRIALASLAVRRQSDIKKALGCSTMQGALGERPKGVCLKYPEFFGQEENYSGGGFEDVMKGLALLARESDKVAAFLRQSHLYSDLLSDAISARVAYAMLSSAEFGKETDEIKKLGRRRAHMFQALLYQFCENTFRDVKVWDTPANTAGLPAVEPARQGVATQVRPSHDVRVRQAVHSAANRAKAKELGRPGTRDIQAAFMQVSARTPNLVETCILAVLNFKENLSAHDLASVAPEIAALVNTLHRSNVENLLVKQGFDRAHVVERVEDMVGRLINPKATVA